MASIDPVASPTVVIYPPPGRSPYETVALTYGAGVDWLHRVIVPASTGVDALGPSKARSVCSSQRDPSAAPE